MSGWQDEAACKGKPVEWFFPEQYDPPATARAREVCNGCPVVDSCREEATLNHELGIWGATSQRQRMALRRGEVVVPLRERIGECRCRECGGSFIGAGRRVVCDLCVATRRRKSQRQWRKAKTEAS